MGRHQQRLLRGFGPLAWLLLAGLLGACEAQNIRIEDGPRLISEVTIAPVTQAPTRAFSPTPTTESSATPTETPTERPRVMTFTPSDSDVATPTLPPSKTPTVTPSVTASRPPSPTPPPTEAVLAQTPVLVPTMVFATPPPAPQIIAAAPEVPAASSSGQISLPLPGVPDVPAASCSAAQWFFTHPRLPDCPPNPPTTSEAAYQNFEFGFMIWIGAQDAIYVVYDTDDLPQWQVFPDNFEEGMPDKDPSLDSQAPDFADFQPRRGFGLVWRTQPGMIERLGWAESDYEQPYVAYIQTRSDGTIFLSRPNGWVVGLTRDGYRQLYTN